MGELRDADNDSEYGKDASLYEEIDEKFAVFGWYYGLDRDLIFDETVE